MADGADRKDADLVVDVRAGSAESFAALYDRWFGPVLGAAQDIVGERAEAARVATDTFQSVWLHLDELADPDGFGAWVLLTSRTFARQRQAERDPSAVAPSGPLFDNEDELRRAVAKVLCRRQVPALGEKVRVGAGAGRADPEPSAGSGPGPGSDPVAEVPEMAFDRLHRYHWAVTDPAPGVADRIRTFRLSPGTLVALAIVLLGSVIWLISRDDTSQIDGGRPAPLFSPASPTTIDGAAARAGNGGAAAPGAEATPPGSVTPDPATPAPTDAVAPAESRKVKVATVLPRAVATTPSRRGTTAAPATAVPITTVPITTVPGTPPTDRPPSTTTTVAPSSSATTASTARTTTTAGSTSTSTTARTTTTGRGGSTTTSGSGSGSGSTTTTGRGGSTTTSGVTTTARGGSTTTTATVTTTRATTTPTTRATTTTTDTATSRPATTSGLASTTRVSASSAAATPVVALNG